ncbi:MAG: acetyl-CoA carboxylase biotin carboxylase subunit [Calditrichaeota bacterium]|nr:acetyl-CoA carboxylase biotin carboxylase subunit [Calditrichota bacterium]
MTNPFSKVLIANRGEIAVRIIRACRELGLKAVAVYSEVDRNARHVREADEAYLIGPAPAAESYLKIERLIETAHKSGCQAVHPGYGFLAENAEFARLVTESGLVFIGSSPESIRLLGDKVESRRTMARAGIPIIPGTADETDFSDAALIKLAANIDFPVLVKAAGGGGGKGMRAVYEPSELPSAIQSARREAQSAFGNPTVYIEKLIKNPRHIEFQIFGDTKGNRVHLFERECSIQRRHQKIIEESPSPALTPELRRQMGQTAVMVAEAAGYYNAGTVEFLLDENKNYYFLEVNTRIQVEHPVTEMVVGVDLVMEQMRVAMGGELSWDQSDLYQRGHSIEARIYAEDAAAGFLPSAGPVLHCEEPRGPGVRFDNGVETGDEITVYYDPIIAKLICWAPTRAGAIIRALQALDRTILLGVGTNIEFLKAVLKRATFASGDYHTGFIGEHLANWTPEPLTWEQHDLALALACLAVRKNYTEVESTSAAGIAEPWAQIGHWEICGGAR